MARNWLNVDHPEAREDDIPGDLANGLDEHAQDRFMFPKRQKFRPRESGRKVMGKATAKMPLRALSVHYREPELLPPDVPVLPEPMLPDEPVLPEPMLPDEPVLPEPMLPDEPVLPEPMLPDEPELPDVPVLPEPLLG